MWPTDFKVIDISQPVGSQTACFPGDVPFSRDITVRYSDSQVMNLCAFTMSPHVGTHADAPVHVEGHLEGPKAVMGSAVGALPLSPYVGPVVVVDISPWSGPIEWAMLASRWQAMPDSPVRVLFKTRKNLRYDVFEQDYAWLDAGLIDELAVRGVKLVGLDTPSVDAVDSKTLDTHHRLILHGMGWLENLDLSQVPERKNREEEKNSGEDGWEPYFLVALPIKLMELEASPVRAVLLSAS